jgi:hypothetical protein
VDFRQGICNPIAFHRSYLAQFEIENLFSSKDKVGPDYQLPFEYYPPNLDAHYDRRADPLVARHDVTLTCHHHKMAASPATPMTIAPRAADILPSAPLSLLEDPPVPVGPAVVAAAVEEARVTPWLAAQSCSDCP